MFGLLKSIQAHHAFAAQYNVHSEDTELSCQVRDVGACMRPSEQTQPVCLVRLNSAALQHHLCDAQVLQGQYVLVIWNSTPLPGCRLQKQELK